MAKAHRVKVRKPLIKQSPSRKTEVRSACGNQNCRLGTVNDGIQCDTCCNWYHIRCGGLTKVTYGVYKQYVRLNWDCIICRARMKACLQSEVEEASVKAPEATNQSVGQSSDNSVCMDDVEDTLANRSIYNDCEEELVEVDTHSLETVSPLHKSRTEPAKAEVTVERNLVVSAETINKNKPGTQQNASARARVPDGKPGPKNGEKGVASGPRKLGKGKDRGGVRKEPEDHSENLVRDLLRRVTAVEADTRRMEVALGHLHKSSDLALGRNRNVVIHGIPEPVMREGRQRDRAMRYHIVNLLRAVELPGHIGIKRVLRLGKWISAEKTTEVGPRPVLVEFANPRHRDWFLAAADKIQRISGGQVTVEPDDTTLGNKVVIKRQSSSPGFNTATMKKPLLTVQRLGEEDAETWRTVTSPTPLKGRSSNSLVVHVKDKEETIRVEGREEQNCPKNGQIARV